MVPTFQLADGEKLCAACGHIFRPVDEDKQFCGHCLCEWRRKGLHSVPMRWRESEEVLEWFAR